MKVGKVAIVYDRVNSWGGAERVLGTLHDMFPDAPLYTSVYDPKKASWAKIFPKIYTSFLQKLPFAKSNHEFLAPLMPIAFELFNFDEYDLVISVSSEAAKGIITKDGTLHINYCLTPTRYLWSGKDFYLDNPPSKLGRIPFFKTFTNIFINLLKNWDRAASFRADILVANSNEVKRRILKYYKRSSTVIFSPVDLKFKQRKTKKKNYYLIVSRLIPYKRIDLAIKAFNKINLPLYIVGTGTEYNSLKSIAQENIKFFGTVGDKKLMKLYLEAKAFIMPQEEDFGIVSLESQLSGTPVIAYGKGGSLDTIIDGKTGVLFNVQNESSLIEAIAKFEKIVFNHNYLVNNASRFSDKYFKSRFFKLINNI